MKRLVILAFACITLGGCAAGIPAVLSEVITDVSDAAQILNVVRSVVNIFFLSHPNPDAQAKVEEAMAKTQLALDGAIRATKGAKNLTEKDNDAAFANFRAAYDELGKVLRSAGVSDSGGKLGAAKGSEPIVLPTPLAMRHQS